MSKRPRTSLLQQRILLALGKRDAGSMAELARSMNAQRPSVSRAFGGLEASGLVTRQGRICRLTDTGREEAKGIEGSLPQKAGQAVSSITKLVERQQQLQGMVSPDIGRAAMLQTEKIRELGNSIMNSSIGRIAEEVSRSSELIKFVTAPAPAFFLQAASMKGLQESVSAMDVFSALRDAVDAALPKYDPPALFDAQVSALARAGGWFKDLQDSAQGMLAVQRIGIDWHDRVLANMQDTQALAHNGAMSALLAENNATIGRMVAEIGRLADLPRTSLTERLIAPTLTMSQAYEAYYSQHAPAMLLEDMDRILPSNLLRLRLDLALPSSTTSVAIRTTRSLARGSYAEQKGENAGGSGTGTSASFSVLQTWETRAHIFLPGLEQLGTKYVRRWNGAWAVLHSDSPDRISQAAHSAREIITTLLHEYAPDASFTPEEISRYGDRGKVTRKMRVRKAIGVDHTSMIVWVDSLIAFVTAGYDALSGEAHNPGEQSSYTVEGVEGMLMIVGGAIQFMIGQRGQ